MQPPTLVDPIPAPVGDEPDWGYWNRASECTIHEAALLSLCLDPRKFGPHGDFLPELLLRGYTNRGAILLDRFAPEVEAGDTAWFGTKIEVQAAVQVLSDVGFDVPELMRQSWREAIAPAQQKPPKETPSERRSRRLARFRELGGDIRSAGTGWHSTGRGALAALIREEVAAGRPMSDKSDVRADLRTADLSSR